MRKLVVYGTEVEVLEANEELEVEFSEPPPAAEEVHLRRRIDPVNLEIAFLDLCVRHGWVAVVREGDADSCFLTDEGERELSAAGIITAA
jgi:hypothetical protein